MILMFQLRREGILAQVGNSHRAVNRITKQLYQEIGDFWHEEFLPRHFLPNARNRYRYKDRTLRWRNRKKRAFERGQAKEPDTDLVYSGRSRDDLADYKFVRAYPTRFSVNMRVATDYFSMRPYKSNHPNMGQETTRVTNKENAEIARFAKKRLPEIIAAERGQPITETI